MTGWYIFDVMRKYRGRRNVWVALLVNHDPDDISLYNLWRATQSRWLELGRHKTRDDAWELKRRTVANAPRCRFPLAPHPRDVVADFVIACGVAHAATIIDRAALTQ
jgi:hypothetical protein